MDELTQSLLRGISALPEREMRLAVLKEKFSSLSAKEIAITLDQIYSSRQVSEQSQKKSADGARAVRALISKPGALKELLGKESHALTLRASADLGLKRISMLLIELRPHKEGASGYDNEESAEMENVPLGVRRARSKTNKKEDLDRLLDDPDPMVIGNLLNNPRITLKEIVKIASKRPVSKEIINLIASHKKWSKDYHVRRAITFNPYSPPALSFAQLEFLLAQDIAEIAEDSTLHSQLREFAGSLLKEREVL